MVAKKTSMAMFAILRRTNKYINARRLHYVNDLMIGLIASMGLVVLNI